MTREKQDSAALPDSDTGWQICALGSRVPIRSTAHQIGLGTRIVVVVARWIDSGVLRNQGVAAALGAALLFGAGTPLAKALLTDVSPWLLAGLLYLGAGVGLLLWRSTRRAPRVRLARSEWPWLAGAVVCGGIAAPVLLLAGLAAMPATGASLLLNAEAVFTALIAWIAFKENVDRRVALGMLAIVAGAVVLTWPGQAQFAGLWPALAVLGACLLWAIDNNLTRRVSFADSTWVAMIKGLVAGTVNLTLAVALGASWPPPPVIAAAMLVGALAYGASLALFVVGLRLLGTARTGAYFSVAPFFGAAVAVAVLGEPVTVPLLVAGVLMGIGVWLHLSESHRHRHSHEELVHEHPYDPDDPHHANASKHSDESADGAVQRHRHGPLTHEHPHYPDLHHRHPH